MKIITIVRTYNEERNLKKFVNAYDWADMVLIQDDWSEEIDYLFEVQSNRVLVSFYTGERIERPKLTRAKQDVQVNSLIYWAEHLEADWIIFDDCDSVPNPSLIRDARSIVENTDRDYIYTTKIHLYKDEGYFPKMSMHEDEWQTCIWAWRTGKGIKCIDNGENAQRFDVPLEDRILRLDAPPYTCIHDPWHNEEMILEKRRRYSQIYGSAYEDFHPLKFGGDVEPVPDWVYK